MKRLSHPTVSRQLRIRLGLAVLTPLLGYRFEKEKAAFEISNMYIHWPAPHFPGNPGSLKPLPLVSTQ